MITRKDFCVFSRCCDDSIDEKLENGKNTGVDPGFSWAGGRLSEGDIIPESLGRHGPDGRLCRIGRAASVSKGGHRCRVRFLLTFFGGNVFEEKFR